MPRILLHFFTSLFFFSLFLTSVPQVFGQAITVQGQVSNKSGQGLAGVSVREQGREKGTATDTAGFFSLPVSGSKARLVISSAGYQTRVAKAGTPGPLAISLAPAEAVAIGYGTKQQEALTGAVAVLKGEKLRGAPAFNVSNNLSGRLAGLMAVGTSGEPGNDGATLRVRGVNTFGSTEPLIVVDGVPGRSLERIDPNTIASISVLKDAAAAIYGMQGANGVILVTTKRGKVGKPAFGVSLSQGVSQPTRLPEMADAATYATILNELDQYAGNSPRYTPEDIRQYADGSDPWGHPNTDWFGQALQPRAGQRQANMEVSGGSKKLQYYSALSTRGQEGLFKNSDARYNQHDFRTNLDGQLNRHLRLGLDLLGRGENRYYLPQAGNSLFEMLMWAKPIHPGYWPNGSNGPRVVGTFNPALSTSDEMGREVGRKNVLNATFRFEADITSVPGLTFKGNLARDKSKNERETVWNNGVFNSWDGSSRDAQGQPRLVRETIGDPNVYQVSVSEEKRGQTLFQGQFDYQRIFAGRHGISLVAGVERLWGTQASSSGTRLVFPGQPAGGGRTYTSSKNRGTGKVFGRVQYLLGNKYQAEFNWAHQATSNLAHGSRSGFFPAIAVGYLVSEEAFWKQGLAGGNYFKLRASYGKTGYNPYSVGSTDPVDQAEREIIYDGDTSPVPGYIGPWNMTWEKARQSNIGFDAGLFENKVSLSVDFFDHLRTDMLRRLNFSTISTPDIKIFNDGKASNRGMDLQLAYRYGPSRRFTLEVGINGGYARSKVLAANARSGNTAYQQLAGAPISARSFIALVPLYYQATGIYQCGPLKADYSALTPELRPGDILFRDLNQDGKITPDDRRVLGENEVPTWTGGLTLKLGYRRFDLSALLQGAAGAVHDVGLNSWGGEGNYLQSFAAERWTPQNPTTNASRAFQGDYWRPGTNTYWLRKTNYLRLKQVEVGYTLPEFTSRYKIKSLRIYVNASNLFTYRPNYPDFDPELSTPAGQYYPLLKTVNGGILLSF